MLIISAELVIDRKVYWALSTIEQAPLEGYKAPPSPLSLKILLVFVFKLLGIVFVILLP